MLADLKGRLTKFGLTLHEDKTRLIIVRLNRGEGRALRPVLTACKVHIEIDLAQVVTAQRPSFPAGLAWLSLARRT